MNNSKTIIADEQKLNDAVMQITEQILNKCADSKKIALIGIVTRGEILARRISRMLEQKGVSIEFGIMDITLYRDDFARKMHKAIVKGSSINFSLDEKHVILVDDVIFTGRTARSAINQIFDFGRPKLLEIAVLVDRGLREVPILANYTGFKIKTEGTQKVFVRLKETDDEDSIYVQDDADSQ